MNYTDKNRNKLFHPKNRLNAAISRIETATILLRNKRYSASIYIAGVAVECVLRAFIENYELKRFDTEHRIGKLCKHRSIDPFYKSNSSMDQCFDTMINYWDNKYRYADDVKLMTFYQARGLVKHSELRDSKKLAKFANDCVTAASKIIIKGQECFQRGKDA